MEAKDWIALGAAGVAAFAALTSAVFSAVTLQVTKKREHMQWVRSSLQEAFVDFLSAAYTKRGAMKHLLYIEMGKPSRRTEKEWFDITRDSHEIMLGCMSRVRVLAEGQAIQSMEAVKWFIDTEEHMLASGDFKGFEDFRKASSDAYSSCRDEFIAVTKRSLDIQRVRRR